MRCGNIADLQICSVASVGMSFLNLIKTLINVLAFLQIIEIGMF